MKIDILGSSSSGNSFLFSSGKTNILIDVGFSKLYLSKKLEELNLSFSDIDAIFISHEHQDHCKALKLLQKSHKVYSSKGTIDALLKSFPDLNYEIINKKVRINDIEVISFKKNHDAKDPIGFIVRDNNNCILNLTDFGSYDDYLLNLLSSFKFTDFLIESNYDSFLLDHGKYPFVVKERIKGDYGHCSNIDSIKFLNLLDLSETKNIILCHLSKNNNSKEIVYKLFNTVFGDSYNLYIAKERDLLQIKEEK